MTTIQQARATVRKRPLDLRDEEESAPRQRTPPKKRVSRAAYQRAWRQANHEMVTSSERSYREKTREHHLALRRNNYAANREREQARRREYYWRVEAATLRYGKPREAA
jgi:hypothetical protein